MANAVKESENSTPKPPNVCSNGGYTSQGLPLRQLVEEQNRKLREKQEVKKMISDMLINGKATGGIHKVIFNVIHMNMFYSNLPCEVGVAKFSIYDGIIDTFHSLIKIPKLPLGSAYEAKSIADKRHGLPLPPNALGEHDLYFVLKNIADFASSSSNNSVILFCHPDEKETIQQGLDYLENDYGSMEYHFMILDFVELFFQAQKIILCGTPAAEISYAAANLILERDIFDSLVKGCEIHDEIDRNIFCSESIVKRQAFQFIDTFIHYFGIAQIPNRHIPNAFKKEDPTETSESLLSFNNLTLDKTINETGDAEHESIAINFNSTNPFININLNESDVNGPSNTAVSEFGNDSDFDLESRAGDTTHFRFNSILEHVRKTLGKKTINETN